MSEAFLQRLGDPVPNQPRPPSLRMAALRHFGKEQEYNRVLEAVAARRALAAKFNGRMLMARGVPDRDVGAFKAMPNFEEWLWGATEEDVDEALDTFMQQQQQSKESAASAEDPGGGAA